MIIGTGPNTYGNVALGATGRVLTSNGTTAVWSPPAGGSVSAGTTNLLTKYIDGLNSVVGSAAGISDDGTNVSVVGSEALLVRNLEGALYPKEIAGADASAKIQAAINSADCLAAGCVIDARNLSDVAGTGPTTISPGTKQVTIYLDI